MTQFSQSSISAPTSYPKFTVAAVQAAPVFFDVPATIEKACRLMAEAASAGARLIAFPEVFIAAYPYWSSIMSPLEGSPWFRKFYLSTIEVNGPEVKVLQQAAAQHQVTVVIGLNERSPVSMGTVYNTNLVIGPDGRILNHYRKSVPTFTEKLSYGYGDGSGIRVSQTPVGRVGVLACGENTNTLARFALLAQGEQIHVANYIAYPFINNLDLVSAIKIRAGAHSFEGKVFTIVATGVISQEVIDMFGTTPERAELLSGKPNAFSGVFGPDGQLISSGLIDKEGIDYAEIDLNKCIEPKQFHDIIGHYNRFDIFELKMNGQVLNPNSVDAISPHPEHDTRNNPEGDVRGSGFARSPAEDA